MKDKPIIDNILKSVARKTEDEVSALLGYHVNFATPENRIITKADFFNLTADKLVLTDLKVAGDKEGVAYLVLSLKDAILLGGTLLMLPPKELENRILIDEFDEEAADAFGEIANIITGVCAGVFDDLYSGKLHFTKVGLKMVVPTKVDLESSEPMMPQSYYLSSAAMKMEGRELGSLQALFPLDIFGWEAPSAEKIADPAAAEAGKKSGPSAGKTGTAVPEEGSSAEAPKKSSPRGKQSVRSEDNPLEEESAPAVDGAEVILVVTDDPQEGQFFTESLGGVGLEVKMIDAQDNIKAQLSGDVIRGVFLVLKNVNEQGIALVIKVRSACGKSPPLLAAGPNWTRNAVLQAVKYGACDIVLTPSSPEEIREKAVAHLGLQGLNN